MPDNYYVYILINPIDLLPFYVGKGKGNRAYNHLKKSHNDNNNAAISALKEAGQTPIVAIIEDNLSEKDAFVSEKEWILLFGRKGKDTNPTYVGYPLLNNKSNGGSGNSKKGKFVWGYDPTTNVAKQFKSAEQLPEGFVRGKPSLTIEQRSHLSTKLKGKYKKPFIDKDLLHKVYVTDGLSIREICKTFKCGIERATNSIDFYGFEKHKNQFHRSKVVP